MAFNQNVAAKDDIVIVLLCRKDCPPCRTMERMLEDHADGLPRCDVRMDEGPSEYPRPCVVIFKGKDECCRHYGAVTYEQLRSMIGDCKAGRASAVKGGTLCGCGGDPANCTCALGECGCSGGDDCRNS